jgi:pimeloyl-ACP methyl ester carboxylesterase
MASPAPTLNAAEPIIRRLPVGDIEVTYHDSGAGHTDLPTIVLVHGTGGSTATHYPFIFPMLSGPQRVLSIDLADPGSALLDLRDFEAQVVGVLEEIQADSITLVGYSLGAVVATSVAGHRPDLVDNLITIAGWAKTDGHQLLRNNIWRRTRNSAPVAAAEFSAFTAYSPGFIRQLPAEYLSFIVDAMTYDEFGCRQMDLNRKIDISEAAAKVQANTLVIACKDDYMVPPHHSRELFAMIDNARYTEVRSGHGVVLERPAELVHLISMFNAAPRAHPIGTVIDELKP